MSSKFLEQLTQILLRGARFRLRKGVKRIFTRPTPQHG